MENWSRPVTTEEIANAFKNDSTQPAGERKWETSFKLKTHRPSHSELPCLGVSPGVTEAPAHRTCVRFSNAELPAEAKMQKTKRMPSHEKFCGHKKPARFVSGGLEQSAGRLGGEKASSREAHTCVFPPGSHREEQWGAVALVEERGGQSYRCRGSQSILHHRGPISKDETSSELHPT